MGKHQGRHHSKKSRLAPAMPISQQAAIPYLSREGAISSPLSSEFSAEIEAVQSSVAGLELAIHKFIKVILGVQFIATSCVLAYLSAQDWRAREANNNYFGIIFGLDCLAGIAGLSAIGLLCIARIPGTELGFGTKMAYGFSALVLLLESVSAGYMLAKIEPDNIPIKVLAGTVLVSSILTLLALFKHSSILAECETPPTLDFLSPSMRRSLILSPRAAPAVAFFPESFAAEDTPVAIPVQEISPQPGAEPSTLS